jgi:hypothetical protein
VEADAGRIVGKGTGVIVVVVAVGIATLGAGRCMMVAEGGDGSRGGIAGILWGTAADTTGAGGTAAGD